VVRSFSFRVPASEYRFFYDNFKQNVNNLLSTSLHSHPHENCQQACSQTEKATYITPIILAETFIEQKILKVEHKILKKGSSTFRNFICALMVLSFILYVVRYTLEI
jgi:hypothetical protein